jgi:hypothetical protein
MVDTIQNNQINIVNQANNFNNDLNTNNHNSQGFNSLLHKSPKFDIYGNLVSYIN